MTPPNLDETITNLIHEHHLQLRKFTENQLVDLLRQLLQSGDIIKYVCQSDNSQALVYLPFSEKQRVEALYYELLYAVSKKWEGETRHETALRYILEAEGTSHKLNQSKKSLTNQTHAAFGYSIQKLTTELSLM